MVLVQLPHPVPIPPVVDMKVMRSTSPDTLPTDPSLLWFTRFVKLSPVSPLVRNDRMW